MRFTLILVGALFTAKITVAQISTQSTHNATPTGSDDSFRAITTATPFLTISPDARQAALGDAGVAATPDANAAYWNPAKLVFIEHTYGGALSYTPWLGKITNDMWISYLTGFYKITREQVIAVGFKYFDLGDFYARDDLGGDLGTFRPREFSADVTYSRMLTENLSVGLTGRYIHSNLLGSLDGATVGITDARPGNSAAADIGVYYNKELKGAKTNTLALAAAITNIGAKISYSGGNNKDFLPTNLRLGGAFTTEVDPHNSFTFLLDFNKLMVPSPPIYERDADGKIIKRDADGNIDNNGQPVILKGKDPDRSLLSGMFGSFSDAPDGFSEEVKEIIINTGVEYWYNKTFAGRVGYFSEAKSKGNRKYMTLGLGFRREKFGIDVAYLVPTNGRENPLAETIRFSILYQLNRGGKEETLQSN
jgi:hypothetical protein